MKKVVLILLSLLSYIGSVYCQFDFHLSQYMLHHASFNPAAVGEGEMIQITGQQRLQWVGMPNAGQTTVFSINSPLKIKDTYHGVGFQFTKDKSGLFTNENGHLQYAFKKRLSNGSTLSIGTDIGITSIGFIGDSVREITSDYHNISGDEEIPKSNMKGTGFDMSLGAFYSTSNYYAGVSYLHLNNPIVEWGDKWEFQQFGSVYVTGGYNWKIPDSKYVFKPSTLFQSDFRSFQLDVTGRVEYDEKYWGGLSYRIQDAAVILAGINIAGGLSIGYSYDLTTSKIFTASSGSHEFLLIYNFQYVFGNKNNKYKSIRLL